MIYTHKIIDAITLEETEIPFTKEEIEAFKKAEQETQARVAEFQAKEAARQSALEKLAGLGLTEAEIQALAGGI